MMPEFCSLYPPILSETPPSFASESANQPNLCRNAVGNLRLAKREIEVVIRFMWIVIRAYLRVRRDGREALGSSKRRRYLRDCTTASLSHPLKQHDDRPPPPSSARAGQAKRKATTAWVLFAPNPPNEPKPRLFTRS